MKSKFSTKQISLERIVSKKSQSPHLARRRIFAWKNLLKWDIGGAIPDGFRKQIRENIKREALIKQRELCSCEVESMCWDICHGSGIDKTFIDTFRRDFDFVRMFHCCHPSDVQSYYSNGIRVLKASDANKQFISHFLENDKFPEITLSHIGEAIERMGKEGGTDVREKVVHFALDDRFIIEHASHYLIYGSEYISVLAGEVGKRTKYDLKVDLRRSGMPTVFIVDIPIGKFTNLDDLASRGSLIWALCIAQRKKEPTQIDFTLTSFEALRPEYIVDHYHPEEVPYIHEYDPTTLKPRVYRYKDEK